MRVSETSARFGDLSAMLQSRPLHEIAPASLSDGAAALGFAINLAQSWQGPAGVVLIVTDRWALDAGRLSPRGLVGLGLDPAKTLVVHTAKAKEALWSSDIALGAKGAIVVSALADADVDLTSSRRLLLRAEQNKSRAILVRSGASAHGAGAAHARWRVNSAPSAAQGRLIGAPAFDAELIRLRGGAPGARFVLEWDAHASAFIERAGQPSARDYQSWAQARSLSAASGDGSAPARRQSGG